MHRSRSLMVVTMICAAQLCAKPTHADSCTLDGFGGAIPDRGELLLSAGREARTATLRIPTRELVGQQDQEVRLIAEVASEGLATPVLAHVRCESRGVSTSLALSDTSSTPTGEGRLQAAGQGWVLATAAQPGGIRSGITTVPPGCESLVVEFELSAEQHPARFLVRSFEALGPAGDSWCHASSVPPHGTIESLAPGAKISVVRATISRVAPSQDRGKSSEYPVLSTHFRLRGTDPEICGGIDAEPDERDEPYHIEQFAEYTNGKLKGDPSSTVLLPDMRVVLVLAEKKSSSDSVPAPDSQTSPLLAAFVEVPGIGLVHARSGRRFSRLDESKGGHVIRLGLKVREPIHSFKEGESYRSGEHLNDSDPFVHTPASDAEMIEAAELSLAALCSESAPWTEIPGQQLFSLQERSQRSTGTPAPKDKIAITTEPLKTRFFGCVPTLFSSPAAQVDLPQ